jgi:hypothetical protein
MIKRLAHRNANVQLYTLEVSISVSRTRMRIIYEGSADLPLAW